ncbi:class I SAM-dependent methyltransferase [Aeromonas tecta]|uniref:class I SAM-dependent methyltransferase n=1 Tax=Aeromonas tecta TaxID=324617 RepID=UPI0006813BC4|nr:class I SAM-dependent methyltransferase [Aeromonas tecta]
MPHSPSPAPDINIAAHSAPRPALSGQAHAPFLTRLKAGAHLLEAGCGGGEDLHHFRELGFVVTAFDASLSQARAASRLCSQPVRVCRFEQMHNVLPFDGIWASASLPCLAEAELAPVLAHLAGLLRPQGPLYCSFPLLGGQQCHDQPLQDDVPARDEYPLRTRLDEAHLAALIAPLPLALQQCWHSDDGVQGRWLHALLIRDANPATINQYRGRRSRQGARRDSASR